MKITDNKRTVDIQLKRWDADSWSPGWGPDCSEALIDESFRGRPDIQGWEVDDLQAVIDYAHELAAQNNALEHEDLDEYDAHPGEWCVLVEDI